MSAKSLLEKRWHTSHENHRCQEFFLHMICKEKNRDEWFISYKFEISNYLHLDLHSRLRFAVKTQYLWLFSNSKFLITDHYVSRDFSQTFIFQLWNWRIISWKDSFIKIKRNISNLEFRLGWAQQQQSLPVSRGNWSKQSKLI